MTDLVARLRQVQGDNEDAREAAAEIERLRVALDADGDTIADIERLRAEAAAEVERLRDHMRALADTSVDRDTAGIFKGLWHGSEKECDELRAEIEWLREALQKIERWSRAYPLAHFPKPDLKRAHELLLTGGITLDSVSAEAMRHVIEGVGEIARRALEPKP